MFPLCFTSWKSPTGLEHYRERHTPDENDRSITPVLPTGRSTG
jgi:hypothetical protein